MTKAERQRIESFRKIGCCITGSPQYDVHHLTEGGRRLGHMFTIPLHPWFHRGVPLPGLNQEGSKNAVGPSLAKSKREFEERFGTERELLAIVDERLKR